MNTFQAFTQKLKYINQKSPILILILKDVDKNEEIPPLLRETGFHI